MKLATILVADRALWSGNPKCFGVTFDQQRIPDDIPVFSAGSLTWHATKEFGGSVVVNVVKPEGMTPEQEKGWEYALSFAEIYLRQGFVPAQQTREWAKYLFT
jgi:hypothetical protein